MSIGADLIRGHTDAIILSLLREKDSYGYEINKTISQVSGGRYELKEATLYTAFKRLEDGGLITSYWGGPGGRSPAEIPMPLRPGGTRPIAVWRRRGPRPGRSSTICWRREPNTMREQLIAYVQQLFDRAADTPRNRELQEEILQEHPGPLRRSRGSGRVRGDGLRPGGGSAGRRVQALGGRPKKQGRHRGGLGLLRWDLSGAAETLKEVGRQTAGKATVRYGEPETYTAGARSHSCRKHCPGETGMVRRHGHRGAGKRRGH